MKLNKYKIGIIGSGNISDFHINVLKSHKNIQIESIYSKTLINAKNKSIKYNIPNFTNSLDTFINFSNYDGLLILISSNKMFQIIKKIIPYQIPLLIEKPPALSLMQLRELITLNKKYKTPNMIGLNRRYYSIIQKGISLIGKNNISSVAIEGHESFWRIKNSKKHIDIKNNWLFANSIHTIDLLSYISNSKIKKISILNLKKNYSENNISAIMKFKNGVLGSYNSFWSSPGQWSLKIFGNNKTVIFGPLEEGYSLDKKFLKKVIKPIKEDTIYKPGFYLQSLNFIKLMRTKKNSWPDVTISSLIDSYTLIENFNLKND